MDLIKLGSGQGIAGEFQFTSMEDVMSLVPFRNEWHYCDGDYTDELSVIAVLSDGSQVKLEESLHVGYASNYQRDYDEEASSIGEQIAGRDVNALIFERVVDNQNEDRKEEAYLPIQQPDWKIVRRRIEDALRKNTDKTVLFSFAQRLNVKIY